MKKRRWQKSDGLSAVMASMPFPESAKKSLKAKMLLCWAAMKDGTATSDDFNEIAAMSNVSLIRAETISPECVDLCIEAQESIMDIRARHDRLGKFGVDAKALRVIPELIDFYSQLLDLSTPRQMEDAVNVAVKRMRQGNFLEA